ncbi:MAG: hypothetical protein AAF502_19480, partial [Bacteroidota bacterium]
KDVNDYYLNEMPDESPIKPILSSHSKKLEDEIKLAKINKDHNQMLKGFLEEKIKNPHPMIKPFQDGIKGLLDNTAKIMLNDPIRNEDDKKKIDSINKLLNKK